MKIHVWEMKIHMYIHVYEFMKLSEPVHTCLYHVQTRMYCFAQSCPGGQDSRWYVIPIQSIISMLPVVPVGDTGTILFHLCNTFPGAPGDSRPGAGDGGKMWFVNSWALGWSRDM